MDIPALAAGPLAININQPGSYLHWSIFTVSVANLVLIAVMVVIFGAALLLPFPKGHRIEPAAAGDEGGLAPTGEAAAVADDDTARMWTAGGRGGGVRLLA